LGEDGSVLVGPPTPNELRDMIVRPAEQEGVAVAADLVTAATAAAVGEPGGLAVPLARATRDLASP
jgi:hypothetical protein